MEGSAYTDRSGTFCKNNYLLQHHAWSITIDGLKARQNKDKLYKTGDVSFEIAWMTLLSCEYIDYI